MIVVDSNVLAARNLEHDKSDLAAQVESLDPLWIVPFLWRYEFQNILVTAMAAKRMTVDEAVERWRHVVALMTENEHEPSGQRVIDLAGRYRITAYDATFIALAMDTGVQCVTEDRELQKKFPAIAVSMGAFVKQGMPEGGVRESRATYRVRRRK